MRAPDLTQQRERFQPLRVREYAANDYGGVRCLSLGELETTKGNHHEQRKVIQKWPRTSLCALGVLRLLTLTTATAAAVQPSTSSGQTISVSQDETSLDEPTWHAGKPSPYGPGATIWAPPPGYDNIPEWCGRSSASRCLSYKRSFYSPIVIGNREWRWRGWHRTPTSKCYDIRAETYDSDGQVKVHVHGACARNGNLHYDTTAREQSSGLLIDFCGWDRAKARSLKWHVTFSDTGRKTALDALFVEAHGRFAPGVSKLVSACGVSADAHIKTDVFVVAYDLLDYIGVFTRHEYSF